MNTIERYYDNDAHVEWERLDRHRTEFAVTMRALAEFLPPPAEFVDAWCAEAPTHHCALGVGHMASVLRKFARLQGLGYTLVAA